MRLLALDLDRTLLPNGPSPDECLLVTLSQTVIAHNITLVYVTARNITSIYDAIARYQLPFPTAVVAQVGTRIYQRSTGESQPHFEELTSWQEHLNERHPRWDSDCYLHLPTLFPSLMLQHPAECHHFKTSFTLTTLKNFKKIVPLITDEVHSLSTSHVELIISQDLGAQKGYVDILPPGVSKKSALDFLLSHLKATPENVIFAGDSENDLSIFRSHYKTIVVANAAEELKEQLLREKAPQKHFTAHQTLTSNGNYSSGILQGLLHYNWISSL